MLNSVSYDRRSFPRQQLQYPLNVDMKRCGRTFGQIVDISLEGMRLLCSMPVKRGTEYDLSFHMPAELYGDDEIQLSAQSIWTRPGPRKGTVLSGFRLTDYWQRSSNHVALSSVITEYEHFLKTF